MNPINFVTRPDLTNHYTKDIVLLSFIKSMLYDYPRVTDPMDRAAIVSIASTLPRIHKFETQEAAADANEMTQAFFNSNGAAAMQDMMNGAYNHALLQERLDEIVKSFEKLGRGY